MAVFDPQRSDRSIMAILDNRCSALAMLKLIDSASCSSFLHSRDSLTRLSFRKFRAEKAEFEQRYKQLGAEIQTAHQVYQEANVNLNNLKVCTQLFVVFNCVS